MLRQLFPSLRLAMLGTVAVAVFAFLLGGLFFGGWDEPPATGTERGKESGVGESAATGWTCSMHPQIRMPGPGKCPICFMDLIPVEGGGGEGLGPRQIRLSATAREIAQLVTAPVRRMVAEREVRLVGKIAYDESNVASITAWVPGRLDRLYADFTGITVSKGDHMVSMYSPELLAAQEELLQAVAAVESLASSTSTTLRSSAEATRTASREKLRLYGLTERQIEEIIQAGAPSEELTINAPIGGVVIQKEALEGMYVQTGTRVYTIADLSTLWVLFEAYESDLPWLRYGQHLEFTSPSFPGERFEGLISFLDPVVDPSTRTIRVRANLDNRGGRLKPEMFVRGIVRSRLNSSGEVVDKNLAGKWICPMHPEVVKNGSGACDVCGMALVRAESLGYASSTKPAADAPLIIPATAPLLTGKRAVVYVELTGGDGPLYEGREVVLGPRAGEFYVVRSGLKEGELVVTEGAFKLDSELQIRAKPSMMSPEGEGAPGAQTHEHAKDGAPGATSRPQTPGDPVLDSPSREGVAKAFERYFQTQLALARDDLPGAHAGFQGLESVLSDDALFLISKGDQRVARSLFDRLRQSASAGAGARDIAHARDLFYDLSRAMIELQESAGNPTPAPVYLAYCPMARDSDGASWLQATETIANPYFGKSMLRCGEIQNTIPAGPGSGH